MVTIDVNRYLYNVLYQTMWFPVTLDDVEGHFHLFK